MAFILHLNRADRSYGNKNWRGRDVILHGLAELFTILIACPRQSITVSTRNATAPWIGVMLQFPELLSITSRSRTILVRAPGDIAGRFILG